MYKKSQMGALHKNTTLLCGKRQARHTLSTFRIADPQSLLFSVRAITLMRVVANWQDNRSQCKCHVLSHLIPTLASKGHTHQQSWCFALNPLWSKRTVYRGLRTDQSAFSLNPLIFYLLCFHPLFIPCIYIWSIMNTILFFKICDPLLYDYVWNTMSVNVRKFNHIKDRIQNPLEPFKCEALLLLSVLSLFSFYILLTNNVPIVHNCSLQPTTESLIMKIVEKCKFKFPFFLPHLARSVISS